MANSARHIVFAKATGTGTQTISTVGFHGTAAIFWSTKQTADGIATDIRWSHGITDGTLQVWRKAHGLTLTRVRLGVSPNRKTQ